MNRSPGALPEGRTCPGVLRGPGYLAGKRQQGRRRRGKQAVSWHSILGSHGQFTQPPIPGWVPGLCPDSQSLGTYCVPGAGAAQSWGSPCLPVSWSICPVTLGGGVAAAALQSAPWAAWHLFLCRREMTPLALFSLRVLSRRVMCVPWASWEAGPAAELSSDALAQPPAQGYRFGVSMLPEGSSAGQVESIYCYLFLKIMVKYT